MAFASGPVSVQVPATSANLGPGYDTFGLALARYDVVSAALAPSGLRITVHGEGADTLARDERHLVVQSMRAAFDRLGGQPSGLVLDCANRIPHERGLGSSAAAIIAGIELARGLVVDGRLALDDEAALALASELEGHPDNVAACLLGGMTVAWVQDGVGQAVRIATEGITPVLFIPTTESSTGKARAALPETVPHADAAFNVARAALLVVAMTGRPDLLLAATADRLHQGYRAAGMQASSDLVARLRDDGLASVISGAGSAVLTLATTEQEVARARSHAPIGWECAQLAVAVGASLA
jgi:homoserine kinase